MKRLRARDFTADRAWGAERLALFGSTGVSLHWTDRPYRWHRNTGDEVFVVLHGRVEMKYREDGEEKSMQLEAGDALTIGDGEEHVAHPVGEARILVIEDINSE
ncbi:cupin domain-containing protein [Maricaulis maris]|jgi:mannose-6-phosphate isomerase-like protein (cupin superfamily)|uniref:cupin domain-containing protein n=1 Tax=Maricaulis maris TaxID=74318 RepID=UPI0026F01EC9|nr:cupin domain-containing protein [Maricaulis maris]